MNRNGDDTEEERRQISNILTLAKITPSAALTISKLDLFQCGLDSLPSNLPQICPQLEILFLFKNNFEEVPEVIGACPNLQMVSFKSNKLTSIHPEALQPQLRWCILTDNCLEAIPHTIGRCVKLQKLMLSGNKIKKLPSEISMCTNLELVRLSSNLIEKPPIDLLSIPALSWVALSDNPFLDSETKDSMKVGIYPDIQKTETVLAGEVLGKGASGITRKVKTDKGSYVAVKKYVSNITSDGNPIEERKASIAASSLECSSMIKVLGETSCCGSLVMELLEGYSVLANPPSMKTCTRDVYRTDLTLTASVAREFVYQLLNALTAIHSIGLCHGDFYGHNILYRINDGGTSIKLSDFGAAFFYEKEALYGSLVEKIEIRAFSHLVEELVQLVDDSCKIRDQLQSIIRVSRDPSIGSFKDIAAILS
mmetsp:Transcript_21800/g.28115  ORF Transcript_21800/g.28115 Transcript_21800/m.28115 type:complete len:424 (-) Transcript_21800:574-1845(-)